METRLLRLFILDLSGYTRFMVNTDLLHGRETISEILGEIQKFMPQDMVLNKVEGDALFFYTESKETGSLVSLSRDVWHHYKDVILRQTAERHKQCPFALCRGIHDLDIKFFVHEGEVAFHRLGDFNELIGKPVIEIHRVMKNSISNRSYVLAITNNGRYHDYYRHLGKIFYDCHPLGDETISINYLNRITAFLH